MGSNPTSDTKTNTMVDLSEFKFYSYPDGHKHIVSDKDLHGDSFKLKEEARTDLVNLVLQKMSWAMERSRQAGQHEDQ